MKDFLELLTSKSVLGALAAPLIALNQKYKWIEISDENVMILVSVLVAVVVAGLRRSNQKIEQEVKETGELAGIAATQATTAAQVAEDTSRTVEKRL